MCLDAYYSAFGCVLFAWWGKKLFKNVDTSIIWLKNMTLISIESERTKEIKRRILSMMLIGTDDDEEAFETKPFNKSTNTAHETSHVELSTDLEGIQHDMVILEFRLNKRYETYTSEIGQLREEMLNSRSLHVNEMQN